MTNPTPDRGLILAAGRGSRMQGLTDQRPKCLVELRGKPLLRWQLDALGGAGVGPIALVRGYRGEMLEGHGLTLIDNPRWMETNMVSSMACAGAWLAEAPCVLSYSDIFYTVDAVRALRAASADLAITYDPNWRALWESRFANPLDDAETFRLDGKSNLVDIGRKPGSLDEVEGQYMGLLRFTPAGWGRISRFLEELGSARTDRLDMTSLLRALLERGERIQAVPAPFEWGEVDSASDLQMYMR